MNNLYFDENGVEIDRNRIVNRKFTQWRRNRKPATAEALERRLDAFFEFCEQYDVLPDIEKLSLNVGVSRVTIFRWRRGEGCSLEWQNIIERAMQQINALTSDAGDTGRLTPVMAIWKQKNQMGYSDTRSLEDADNERLGSYTTSYQLPQQILQKYAALPDNGAETLSDTISDTEAENVPLSLPEFELITDEDFMRIPDNYDEDNVPFA